MKDDKDCEDTQPHLSSGELSSDVVILLLSLGQCTSLGDHHPNELKRGKNF